MRWSARGLPAAWTAPLMQRGECANKQRLIGSMLVTIAQDRDLSSPSLFALPFFPRSSSLSPSSPLLLESPCSTSLHFLPHQRPFALLLFKTITQPSSLSIIYPLLFVSWFVCKADQIVIMVFGGLQTERKGK